MGTGLQTPLVKRMGHNHSAYGACYSWTRMEIHACDVRRTDEVRLGQRQETNVAEADLNMGRGGEKVLGTCRVAEDESATGGDELGLGSSGKQLTVVVKLPSIPRVHH